MLTEGEVVGLCGEITLREDEPPKLIARAFAPLRVNSRYTHRPSPFTEIMAQGNSRGGGRSRYTRQIPENTAIRSLPTQKNAAPRVSTGAINSPYPAASGANPPYQTVATGNTAVGGQAAQSAQATQSAQRAKSSAPIPGPREAYKPSVYDFKTAYSKLYVRFDFTDVEIKKKVEALLSIFAAEPGMNFAQVIFFDTATAKYLPRPELNCAPIAYIVEELSSVLGAENVVHR